MNSRFPLLSAISILLKIVGAMAASLGVLAICYSLFSGDKSIAQAIGNQYPAPAVIFGVGILFVLGGLITMAAGEVIGVLFAIEEHTRNTSLASMANVRPV